jgi:hypothetical protein
MQDTVERIVVASIASMPLSIVIVGVGNDDLELMVS